MTANSTGDPKKSTLDYTAPVPRAAQDGRELGVLDIANPTMDISIGVPAILTSCRSWTSSAEGVLDLAVSRRSVGELRGKNEGAQAHGLARLFDLEALPGDAIGVPESAEISSGEPVAGARAPSAACSATSRSRPRPPRDPRAPRRCPHWP